MTKFIGVTPCVLYEWIRRYESSGEKTFEKCYTFYPAQYKLDILYYMNEHGTSIRETAALSYETLRKWKISYETGELDALQLKKKGCPTMKNKTSS